jgi:cellulose synthase/poly-beta-1,6-N-acetylglucosamine synthase-like glycosyltransferase
VTTDSDSYLEPHFLERVERAFENRETAAFAGYVRSTRDNWLTSCRELDYALGQNLHKKAQSNIGYLYVIPGCAGAFRTKMFKKTIKFEHDTLTEDLDFTYKLHKAGQKVVYDDRAICYTQDPNNLKAFVNQTRRWYAGGWQNLFKHIGLVKKQPQAAMELSFAYIEGTVFAGLLFALPFINPRLYFSLMAVSMGIISIFAIYSARKSNRWDTLPSIFLMPMIYYIQAYIFFEQFVSVALIGQKNLTWYQPERSLAVQ